MCMFVSDVHICIWYAHLFLVCAFISSVHICIWCVPCVCCVHLYLLCMFVYGVHLCIWCAPLYLLCTFVSSSKFVAGVHIRVWWTPLYLVCMFVSGLLICIWCACLYQVCTFASGVLLLTQYHPALHPSLVLQWDQYIGHLFPLLMPNIGSASSNNVARALVTHYLNSVNKTEVCYSRMFVAVLVTWYDSVHFCSSVTPSVLLTYECVSFVMLGEFGINYGYTYTLLDMFGWVGSIELHFLAFSLSVDPQHSTERVKIIVLQTLCVCVCVCVRARAHALFSSFFFLSFFLSFFLTSHVQTLCYRVPTYFTVSWGLYFSSWAVQETCWASAAGIWGLCWLLVIV
jgi:hypothetical protein